MSATERWLGASDVTLCDEPSSSAIATTPNSTTQRLNLKSARIRKCDRPRIDPFTIREAETLIAAIYRDWGEAQGNDDEFPFCSGLRPSEQIALVLEDFDALRGTLRISKARVAGVDKDSTKTGEDRLVPAAREPSRSCGASSR